MQMATNASSVMRDVPVNKEDSELMMAVILLKYYYIKNFHQPLSSNLKQLASVWPMDDVGRLCGRLEERTTRAINFIHDIIAGYDINKQEYPSAFWSRLDLTAEEGNALTLAVMLFESVLHWNQAPAGLVDFVKERKTAYDNIAKFLHLFEEIVAILSELGTLSDIEKCLSCTYLSIKFPISIRMSNIETEKLFDQPRSASKGEVVWKMIDKVIHWHKAQSGNHEERFSKIQQALGKINEIVENYAEDVLSVPFGRDSKSFSNWDDFPIFFIFFHYTI